jgi:hypothetical protein
VVDFSNIKNTFMNSLKKVSGKLDMDSSNKNNTDSDHPFGYINGYVSKNRDINIFKKSIES